MKKIYLYGFMLCLLILGTFLNQVYPACTSKPGDANGDDKVTLADIIYKVNYIFKGGAAPSPLCRGDDNADSVVNMQDLIYEINYIFKGGPSPKPIEVCCQGFEVSFITPIDSQVVGGPNELVWATVSTIPVGPVEEPIFKFSFDGVTYYPLPFQVAPDFGKGSTATAINLETLPSGPLYIRAFTSVSNVVRKMYIDRLPIVSCELNGIGSTVNFDASASADSDGFVILYKWNFGDGTLDSTSVPFISHHYPDTGHYDFELLVCDNQELCNSRYYTVVISDSADSLQDPDMCGCKQMILGYDKDQRQTTNSELKDGRRPTEPPDRGGDKAPLGKDPSFVSFNFEIKAILKEGSNPARCKEGQSAKGTIRDGNETRHKKACSAGKMLAACENDRECDTYFCDNPGKPGHGQPANNADEVARCHEAGGSIKSNNDGKCTEYPSSGGALGDDDYRYPSNRRPRGVPGGPKAYVTGSTRIVWLDTPGAMSQTHSGQTRDYRFDGEFVAFVEGDGECDCSCHFKLVIDWDGRNGTFKAGTGITLIEDAQTKNCTGE